MLDNEKLVAWVKDQNLDDLDEADLQRQLDEWKGKCEGEGLNLARLETEYWYYIINPDLWADGEGILGKFLVFSSFVPNWWEKRFERLIMDGKVACVKWPYRKNEGRSKVMCIYANVREGHVEGDIKALAAEIVDQNLHMGKNLRFKTEEQTNAGVYGKDFRSKFNLFDLVGPKEG